MLNGSVSPESVRSPVIKATKVPRRLGRRGFVVEGAVAGAGVAILGVRPTSVNAESPIPSSSPKPVEKTATIPPATATPDPLAAEKAKLDKARATLTVATGKKELEEQVVNAQHQAEEAQKRINELQNPTVTPDVPATATESAIVANHATRVAVSDLTSVAKLPTKTPNAVQKANTVVAAKVTEAANQSGLTIAKKTEISADATAAAAIRERDAAEEAANKEEEDRIRRVARAKEALPVIGLTPQEAGVTAGVSILAGGAVVDQLKGKGAVRKAIGGGITTIAKKIPLVKKFFGP